MSDGMTVTELAAATGMTARNIRAYQSKGLLPPPTIKDRTARYASGHVARLHLIASLQREGFTLAAIKRLLETPDSYSRIVADRRRRFRENSSDIPPGVAMPPAQVEALQSGLVDQLVRLGLAWYDDEGTLMVHTLFVGVGRTLDGIGLPAFEQTTMFVDAAEHGARIGSVLRAAVDETFAGDRAAEPGTSVHDVTRIVVQLHAAAFEVAMAHAARTPIAGA
jgi:DNA-binding transcriptional MerR regulator